MPAPCKLAFCIFTAVVWHNCSAVTEFGSHITSCIVLAFLLSQHSIGTMLDWHMHPAYIRNIAWLYKLGLTWPLVGRVGLAECGSAAASEAAEGLAEDGLKSWRVAREGGRGWAPSWGCWNWALGE